MLKIVLVVAMALTSLIALPLQAAADRSAPQSTWDIAQLSEKSGKDHDRNRRPRPRPTYYYCVLDEGGSCPSDPGRVGGRCRCTNQTGSGRLIAR